MEEDNVTFRRQKTNGNDSLDLSFESTTTEVRRCSLPDLSTAYDSDMEDIKEELNKLKMELESAHMEIEKLNEENMTLKFALNKEKIVSKNLQKICSDTKSKGINIMNSKSKRKKRISRNFGLAVNEQFNNSYVDLGINESSEVTTDGTTGSQTAQPKLSEKIGEVTAAHKYTESDNQLLDGITSTLLERPQAKQQQRICLISSNKTNKKHL
ncbi:hypothetical protein PYW08_008986 [Mythimna loreyi]|uniref:Uncharacterized protein n=1 Tax=Mythimna loreyi TaxID=667449 RepID=A0ACC2Q857_9NEOP|nr:hypothetical protein PYW08_008986 [Mythimna loreyi]